jgi:exosortase C (VPDSG-CTERM-specific)
MKLERLSNFLESLMTTDAFSAKLSVLRGSVVRFFIVYAALLSAFFTAVLVELAKFAYTSELFSYILLIPFISIYLAWLKRRNFKNEQPGARWPAIFPAIASLIFLSTSGLTPRILAYCCFLWAGAIFFLGMRKVRIISLPLLFLVFITPIPEFVINAMEAALQHGSADLAYGFIQWSGIPVFRSGLVFNMPGISLGVAPECSGIRSTLILFLCSLIAAHLFLRKAWMQWILALFVIPLGIARNAFRILVLALLCVRVDLSYIHSPIHHSGGPIFFVLSLILFGAILLLLKKIEKFMRT